MEKIVYLLLVLVFFLSINTVSAVEPHELIGWHERLDVTDVIPGFLNDSKLGIAIIFLL